MRITLDLEIYMYEFSPRRYSIKLNTGTFDSFACTKEFLVDSLGYSL